MSLEQLVSAVLAEGLDTFSMPSVARRLGVAHSGLYRYVESREELLVATLDHLVRETEWPSTSLPWREQLTGLAQTHGALCEQHRGYAASVLTIERVPEASAAIIAEHANALAGQDFQLRDAFGAVQFVTTLALAASLTVGRSLSGAARQLTPTSSAEPKVSERSADSGWCGDQLAIYLDGLEGRVSRLG
jgi:AcrR family transcriptional regulator